MMGHVAAIILAAGRGTRMKSTTTNKVMSDLGGRPMLSYTIDNFTTAGLHPIIIVVGFAKESIMDYFGDRVLYAVQEEATGTAHALLAGLSKVPANVNHVLSVYGDDSYCYRPELLRQLVQKHVEDNADVTLLTVEKDNPFGLGRIIRDTNGIIKEIVEEKVATDEQKKTTEVNTGCFVFNKTFINEYIHKIEKNPVAGEYYLTDIIEVARKHGRKIEIHAAGKIPWQGVNRPEELEEARELFLK